jgi:tetratricopeptide (TPR) repeat protein
MVSHINNFPAVQLLNNHGAALFASGDTQSALDQFSGALRLVRQIMSRCSVTIPKADVGGPTTFIALDECMIQSRRLLSDSSSIMKDETTVDDQNPYLYRYATLIPSCLIMKNEVEVTMTISVLVMFNLALAHQQRACEIMDSKSAAPCVKLTAKAIHLYELAFQLYSDFSHTTSSSFDAFFYMALMNNLALAKHGLNDKTASEQCLKQLLTVFMLLTETRNQHSTLDDSSLFDGFLRNVSHLVSPHRTASAA